MKGLVLEGGGTKGAYQIGAYKALRDLGIEIKNVNGVIKGYDSLKSKIDEVMEKKKAQIILDSQESLYAEAIN